MTGRPARDPETLDGTIYRMARMLATGKWPSGLALTDDDRRMIEWNLRTAREERGRRRRDRDVPVVTFDG